MNTTRTKQHISTLALLMAALLAPIGLAAKSGIHLRPLGTYETGLFDEAASEIVAHDPTTQRVYVVNAQAARLDVLDIRVPQSPRLVATLDVTPYGAVANSVAVRNGVVAVAVEADPKTDPGNVVFLDNNLQVLSIVQVGALPDMLTFSPDGNWVLVANEGEPSDDYVTDPEGSVSLIDVSGGAANVTQANVTTAGFTAFNGTILDPSIRIFGTNFTLGVATVAQDLEPEYIAVSPDSATAWVTLQENNALAVIDIAAGVVTELIGLGFKDHSLPGNGFDASDRDGVINIANWPVLGMYQPDSIAAFTAGGQTYLILANEGDSRDWDGFSEATRVGALTLDPTVFPDAEELQENRNLGRLNTTSASGDLDGDGDHDVIYAHGARSFSIRRTNGELVFDSGDFFEQLVAAIDPKHFNASHTNNDFDNRSDDKGPEPEALTVGVAYGRTLAFVGFERYSGIAVFDVSDPTAPEFLHFFSNRNFGANLDQDPVTTAPAAGDLGPEGIAFISAANSPNGVPLLAVGNEVSGTTTIYEIRDK